MKGVSQGARYYLKKPVWLEEVKNIWHLVAQKNLFNTAKSGTMPAGTDKNPLIPSSKRQRENGNEEEEEQQQQDDERRYRTTHTVMKWVSHGARDYQKKPARLEEVKNNWHHVVQKNLFHTAKSGTMPVATDKNPPIPSSKRQREKSNEEEEEQQQEDDERR
ncbi:Two-component response regulator ARR18 [Camellia lanceoleosa]|uniref:Two-component response regulator ARR18 n=1 Tax=Camellia lanceoleosa TaxID=1840588 RepID=A0ACC0FMH0_9ERIC|nr:Two-component response regulator ARR18 [Camellia lanceoleosa]